MSPVLEIEGIHLGFGGLEVLRGVSLEVGDELLAVIGPNGSGKTSVLNCINGIYRPQHGSIRLEGRELVGLKPSEIAHLGIARTFQNLALFANLDLVENLMLGRHHLMTTGFVAGSVWFGKARTEEVSHRRRVGEIIELLRLGDYVGRPVGLLPYGVQKRVEFGRALAMDPRLLLIDEPVAGMNHDETATMAGYILDIRRALGVPMLLIEHDMHLVVDVADRLVCLSFGEVLAEGLPLDVISDEGVIEAYLGASRS